MATMVAVCEIAKCNVSYQGEYANQSLGMHRFSAHGIRGKSALTKRRRKAVKTKRRHKRVKREKSRGVEIPPDSPAYQKPEDTPGHPAYQKPVDIFMPRVCVHSSMPLEDYLNRVRAQRDLLGERYSTLSDIVEGIEYHLNGDANIKFEQTPTFTRSLIKTEQK